MVEYICIEYKVLNEVKEYSTGCSKEQQEMHFRALVLFRTFGSYIKIDDIIAGTVSS
jgi:hypothetical protein